VALALGSTVGILVRVQSIGLGSLKLKKQGWILDLDQVVDILESGFHQLHLRLDGVVAISDRCAHGLFRTGEEFARKKLDELVLNVLNEVKFGLSVMVHDEDSQKAVRVFDARVRHLYKNVCIFLEVHHELLLLLHVAESVFIYTVCVMEKQIVFTRQLDFDLLNLILARSKLSANRRISTWVVRYLPKEEP